MRRSLLARLLALSLAVAACAIATTAWLTTRGTSEALRSGFERTVANDSRIYKELASYATEHPTWAGVDGLVTRLARETEQRIALTDAQGRVLADSAAGDREPPALPPSAAAVVDPFAPALQFVERASALPGGIVPDWLLGETTGRDELDPRVTTNPDEIVSDDPKQRDLFAAQVAARCLSGLGHRATVVEGWPLASITFESAPMRDFDRCLRGEFLFTRGSARDIATGVADDLRTCLDRAGRSGTIRGIAFTRCRRQAVRTVYGPQVADAAHLYLGVAAEDRFASVWETNRPRTAAIVLTVLIVTALVTVLAGRRLVRPIRALTRAAQRMEAGDRSARVTISGRDEVGRLASAFNAMAEAVEANERQRRAMVSDVAHELRAPLTNIRGYLEAAAEGVVPLEPALVDSLLEESTALGRLVDDLQDLALADAGRLHLHPEHVDAADVVRAVAAAQRRRAAAANVTLAVDANGPVPVLADPGRLRQALGNLVANAIRYTRPGGRVTVSAAASDAAAILTVRDTGIGIPAGHLPHVFDRFYRADPSRSRNTGGSGLGLAITKQLVDAHGGVIQVLSEPGQGSIFTVRLPLAPSDWVKESARGLVETSGEPADARS
jgi:two-component system sensor histidine kinase BaeS